MKTTSEMVEEWASDFENWMKMRGGEEELNEQFKCLFRSQVYQILAQARPKPTPALPSMPPPVKRILS